MPDREGLAWLWVWISFVLTLVGVAFMIATASGAGLPYAIAAVAAIGTSLFFRGLAWRNRRQFRTPTRKSRSTSA